MMIKPWARRIYRYLSFQWDGMLKRQSYSKEYLEHSFDFLLENARFYVLAMVFFILVFYYSGSVMHQYNPVLLLTVALPAVLFAVFGLLLYTPLRKSKAFWLVATYYTAWFFMFMMSYGFILANWETLHFYRAGNALLLTTFSAYLCMRGPVRVLSFIYGIPTLLFLSFAGLFPTPLEQVSHLYINLIAMLILTLLYYHAEQLRKEVFHTERDLEQKLQELECLSRLDGLTRLNNRRYFDDTFHLLLKDHVWKKKTMTLIFLKVDAYEEYLKTYGRAEANKSLQRLASTLQEDFSGSCEMSVRYADHQFALVCDMEKDEAFAFAEKLRISVEKLDIEHKNWSKGILSVSIGMATLLPRVNTDEKKLIQNAEEALQWSRKNGGDQFCMAS